MIMRRRTMSPAERAKLEFAQAKAAKNEANIEYIAMMTDVELDTGSDETEEDENDEQ